jgi:hypothetical protein
LGQFLLAGEEFVGGCNRSGGFLLGSERADIVFGIDGERHFQSPLFRSLCGHDMDRSEVLETQAINEINLRGRRAGDAVWRLAGIGI